MCSSEVMLRMSSSVSSGFSGGPSTRCRMPCKRITGGAPTRRCRSDDPSDTTNCNRSDIEYIIKSEDNLRLELGGSLDCGAKTRARSIQMNHSVFISFYRVGLKRKGGNMRYP